MRPRSVFGSGRRAWSAVCGVALIASVLVGVSITSASAATTTTINVNGSGGGRVFETGVRPAQPEVGHRQVRVGAEGLVEGARRLDPDV